MRARCHRCYSHSDKRVEAFCHPQHFHLYYIWVTPITPSVLVSKLRSKSITFFVSLLVYRNFLQQSFKFFYLLIWERERKGERERNLDLLFHSFMHLLVDSCRCPDGGSNLQTWLIGMMLSPTRLPVQGLFNSFNPRNIEFTSLIYVYLYWVYSFSCKIFLSFNVLPLF